MYRILTILLLLLSWQAFGQTETFTLSNGLKVVVKPDHRAPIAVSMIWYKIGSADEPGGITGVSHAIEHMMFKGTKAYPLGVFSKTIASQGGQENAFTNTDYTAFFEKMHAERLPIAFQLEADRMTNLLLDGEAFAKEIKVIQEERRMRTDNNPQALAFERFLATAHLASPYHHPVIGWMSDLKQMQIEDVRQWYRTYYAPNNATLIVVGDVEPKKIYAMAQQYFGALKPMPIPKTRLQKEPPKMGEKSIVIHGEAQVPLLLLGYTVPSVQTASDKADPYALEIIAAILDAGDGARFAQDLIRGSHVATGADASYNLYAKYQTQFMVYGSPSENHTVQELQQGLMNELHRLKTTAVSKAELQRAKTQIIAQKTFEKDSIFGQAMELGLLETVGLGWQYTDTYVKSIEAVTPAQIQKAAQTYFVTNNRTQATLLPSQRPHHEKK